MTPIYLVLLILMNVLWSASYPAFKYLAPYLTAGELSTLRFGLATVAIMVFWPVLPGAAPRGRDLLRGAVIGVLVFCASPRLQVAGVQLGQAGDASLLMALDPLITSIAAALFLREAIPARLWIGFVAAMAGVVLLSRFWTPEFKGLAGLLPNTLFIASFFCEATYSVMGKPMLERVGLLKLLAVSLLAGTAVNLLLSGPAVVAVAPKIAPAHWLLLIYFALICTLAGYILWYVIIRRCDVSLAAMTVFVQPISGFLISWLLLGEQPHAGHFWGSCAIIAGLWIGLRRSG